MKPQDLYFDGGLTDSLRDAMSPHALTKYKEVIRKQQAISNEFK
jgi:hypothetical protein